ncbi:MAG TPA: efflux RND transporter periplasmic adaptor subunit [Tepidisphaeraceae bacterium]|nr:efflux RND transporter periplasmic adaptor subunit [Tepidisphaeraceae bacterium]
MKILIWIVVSVVVLAGVGIGVAVVVARRAASANSSGTSVRVEQAALGDLVDTITAPGMIQAKTKVSISARVAARIIDLPFKEGDKVTKGNPTTKPAIPASLLVRLDATDLEADLRSSQAHYNSQQAQMRVSQANIESQKSQIESSKAMLEDAKRDLKRQQELMTSKDVSQAIVDTAQSKVDQLQASLEAAQHSLEGTEQNLNVLQFELQAADADIAKAKDNLSYTQIMSPIDGVVTRVNAQAGELVVTGTMNNAGTVIMEVADLSEMLLEARVDESSIALVKVGQKATVRIPAYQDQEFTGVVTTVALADTTDTTMGSNQRFFKADILIDTKNQQIISGLNADADIETASYHNVILVPSQAVLGRPLDVLPPGVRNAPEVDAKKTTATVVYRVVNGKAMVTPVTIGASDVTRTVIKSGLKQNDLVITGPFKVLDTLTDGQAVTSDSPLAKATTQATTEPTTAPATQPAPQAPKSLTISQ